MILSTGWRGRLVCIFLCVVAGVVPAAAEEPTSALRSRADQVAALFSDKPGGYDALFADNFLQAVGKEHLSSLLTGLDKQVGGCAQVTLLDAQTANAGTFQFRFEKGFEATVTLGIERAEPHKISTFFIGKPAALAKSTDDIVAQLKALPGTTSLQVARIDGQTLTPIASLTEDRQMAIGSTFKLYVLAALIDDVNAGRRHWSDVVELDEANRSLPSGALHAWPAGSPITLHTLATLLISQSDNTATDQLIHTLGRERVEKAVAMAGHSQPARNVPFLTTLEMFKLKGDATGEAAKAFLAADTTGRRRFLDGPLAAVPRSSVAVSDLPMHIDHIEWFASTADLCRAMVWIRSNTEAGAAVPARQILAVNHGIAFSSDLWKYVGYKGGSETGVVNTTYLLQSTGGQWYLLSETWNNPKAAVDNDKFFGIVRQTVQLLERGDAAAPATRPSPTIRP